MPPDLLRRLRAEAGFQNPGEQVVTGGGPEFQLGLSCSDDTSRQGLERYIADCYARRYGATIGSYMPYLLSLRSQDSKAVAVVGLRLARQGPFFLEGYLDSPIDQLISGRFNHVELRIKSFRCMFWPDPMSKMNKQICRQFKIFSLHHFQQTHSAFM